jgi:hypothetical protein
LRINVIFGIRKKKNVNGGDKKMPGGDRTGPEGYGARTGRGLGYCSGYDSPGFTKGSPSGRGFSRGWGRGFGRGYWGRDRGFWRRDYYPDLYYRPVPYYRDILIEPSKDEEKSYLEDVVKGLKGELKAIKERLQELSKEKKEAV